MSLVDLNPTQLDLRRLALTHAVASEPEPAATEDVVKRAEAYYAFLAGDDS